MAYFDKTIEIAAPPERVFPFLAHVWRAPRWHPGFLRASADDHAHPLRPGARFYTVEEALGLRLERESEALAVDPHYRFAWRQRQGDFTRHEGDYVLEATPRGTRVRLRLRVELPFILPKLLTEEEIHRALSQREDAALWRLKDLCEGRRLLPGFTPPAPPPSAHGTAAPPAAARALGRA